MTRIALSLAFIVLLVAPSLAQAPPASSPTRVRGTVEKLDGQNLAVKTREGPVATIALAPNFTVNGIVKKDLADIKQGDYVGVASTKGTDGKLHALEVLIFPEAMRGTAEGQFPWDLQPESLMTNAAVAGVAAAPTGRTLKLAYKGGESEIVVGPDAPIVTFQPADASLLKPGATVFIVAQKQPDGTLTAARVTAEKDGVKPPM
ncbi:MAG TPA: DUF5666 domain-containing protein [Stellaceae bacterium]|nr:DUF5666 domain-containing protein [Stellaceae bacterium]